MKRLFVLLLIICLSICAVPCHAEVDFDPTLDTEQELREILAEINLHLSETIVHEGDVLYDSNGIYVEFRGLEECYGDDYFLKIFIRNDTDEEVWLYLESAFLDRATLTRSNADATVAPKSLYVSSVGSRSFILYTDVLEDYGIAHGTYLECTFTLYYGDMEETIPLNLVVDITP